MTEVTETCGSENISKSKPLSIANLDLYWSKEYIMAANEFLQNQITEIYTNLYTDSLFNQNDSEISRKDLQKKVVGGKTNTGKVISPQCNWLFDSSQLRLKFRELFDKDVDRDTEDN